METELFARPNTEARIHQLQHFRLNEPTPDRPGYRSALTFAERNGAPRIVYFTGQAEKKSTFIGFAPEIFEMFLCDFEEVARGPNDVTHRLANMIKDVSVEQPTERGAEPIKILKNHLVWGKDNEGVCWLGIQEKNIPNLRFRVLISDWHYFVKEDGTPISKEESSVRYTLALIKSLRRAYAWHTGKIQHPWEPREKRNKPPLTGAYLDTGVSGVPSGIETDIPFN